MRPLASATAARPFARHGVAVALALLVALAVPGIALAEERYVLLHDWTHGHSLAGTTTLAPSPAPHVLVMQADACHPYLLLDLLYEPGERAVDLEGVGEVAVAYRYAVEVWLEGERIGAREIPSPGYGRPIALLPNTTEGAGEREVEVRFWLTEGAFVSWDARVRGEFSIDDPACQDPL